MPATEKDTVIPNVILNGEGLLALKYFFYQRIVKEPSYETLLQPAELLLALNFFPNSETSIFVGFIEHQFFG